MNDLHDLLAAFAAIGTIDGGGVCRLTGTQADKDARDLLRRQMDRRGLVTAVDPIGNMFSTATLVPSSNRVLLVGSHLDSQPTGGRYDGVYGVLAGLLAVQAIADRARANPGKAWCNIALVNWTNEEGARFQPSLTGSSVFVGGLSLAEAYACKDADGIALRDALSAIGYLGTEEFPLVPVGYVELHVEQGDRLERAGADIAAVSGAWVVRKMSVWFEGEVSHTGPTPMASRRDAMRAAARAIEALYCEVESGGEGAHASAARISVFPNSPNVVAGRVGVWFEVRHEESDVVLAISARFLARIERSAAELGVSVTIGTDEQRAAPAFDPAGVALVQNVARDLDMKVLTLRTIAGHDALALQRKIPATLIFVPSHDGISHNPREFTAPEALDRGYDVLVETLWRMLTAEH